MKLTLFFLIILGFCLFVNFTWYLFLQLFRMFDNYMMDKQFKKINYEKMKCENGKTWYVG